MPKGKFLHGLAVAAVAITTTVIVVVGLWVLLVIGWLLLGGGIQIG